jgi:FlaA1/EpsC-like NDP-sugar epimerase
MNNYFKKILIERRSLVRLTFFLFTDAILISASVLLAFAVRFEGGIPIQYFENIPGIIILTLSITIPIFYFFRLYYFSWDFVSTTELLSLVQATGLSFLIFLTSFFILRDYPIFSGFPRSTLFITYFFVFIFCGAIRFTKRIYRQAGGRKGKERKERTLIVGAGEAGEQILRNILSSRYSPYLPLGFIDDSPSKKGLVIHGLKILGRIDDIPQIAKDHNIDSLIIAFPSASSEIIKKAEKKGVEGGIMNIKYLPPMTEIIDGADKSGIGILREIDMEDLLGREAAILDQKPIENFIKNKKVLITGGAGSIGSELCRQVAKFKPSLLMVLDQDETGIFNINSELKENFPKLNMTFLIADIQNDKKINQIFQKSRPNLIFHAAAYKHVPLMEEHPDEAVKNNIFGTEIIAKTSLKYGAEKFIFISTDKAVNPTSVMGATKRVGEMISCVLNQKNNTKFISVRFGNVLNSRGSVIPIFREQISKGGPIKITHKDMERFFMIAREACLLVLQAGAKGKGGEVFVLDMGNPVRIVDLAKELIKRSGFEPERDIRIEYTAPRPGEKFFEEILTAEEGIKATANQKIFMAKISDIDEKKLNSGIEKLKKASDNLEREKIKFILKELIPSYSER